MSIILQFDTNYAILISLLNGLHMFQTSNILKNKKIFISINIILFLTLILLSMLMVRDIISFISKAPIESKIDIDKKTRTRKKKLLEYSEVVSNNPFGIKNAELKELKPFSDTKKKPQFAKRVDLVLLGTISGEKGNGFAIIENEKKTQEVFQIGEEVFDTGKLGSVTPSKAIIRGENEIEIFLADIPRSRSSRSKNIKRFKKPSNDNKYIQRRSEGSYIIDQRKVQEAIENPQQLMTEARLLPWFKKGKQEGFILKRIKRGGIYDQLGLKNGDILLSINQLNIKDPEMALQAFTALRGVNNIRLDIIRNNKNLTLNYMIK